jgi:hypothetical protein
MRRGILPEVDRWRRLRRHKEVDKAFASTQLPKHTFAIAYPAAFGKVLAWQ